MRITQRAFSWFRILVLPRRKYDALTLFPPSKRVAIPRKRLTLIRAPRPLLERGTDVSASTAGTLSPRRAETFRDMTALACSCSVAVWSLGSAFLPYGSEIPVHSPIDWRLTLFTQPICFQLVEFGHLFCSRQSALWIRIVQMFMIDIRLYDTAIFSTVSLS